MKRNKNDRNDARGLADLVRMGWYREARVRSLDAQYIRSMLVSRQQLLQSRRAVENQIRGALKTLGVMTGPTKGRGFMPRVVALRADNDWLGPVLDPLIAARAAIAKQLRMVSESVLLAAREDADVRRMMTVPGIGAMMALAFKAAIDDPKRFTSSAKVGPYLGLTPRQYQSGESEWIGGIGKTNDPLLRYLSNLVVGGLPASGWASSLSRQRHPQQRALYRLPGVEPPRFIKEPSTGRRVSRHRNQWIRTEAGELEWTRTNTVGRSPSARAQRDRMRHHHAARSGAASRS
jgi:transposase